jgi:hypothetical protein
VKKKKCGVADLQGYLEAYDPPTPDFPGLRLILEVNIKFKSDEVHDPACCDYEQEVKTTYIDWRGWFPKVRTTAPMHDDNYSRADDLDRNPDVSDPDFYTNDVPGLPWVKPDDWVFYSFTAVQRVRDNCNGGALVEQRGPHTAMVWGRDPRSTSGLPATLE